MEAGQQVSSRLEDSQVGWQASRQVGRLVRLARRLADSSFLDPESKKKYGNLH